MVCVNINTSVNSAVCHILLDVRFSKNIIKDFAGFCVITVPCITMYHPMLVESIRNTEFVNTTECFQSVSIVIAKWICDNFLSVKEASFM